MYMQAPTTQEIDRLEKMLVAGIFPEPKPQTQPASATTSSTSNAAAPAKADSSGKRLTHISTIDQTWGHIHVTRWLTLLLRTPQ